MEWRFVVYFSLALQQSYLLFAISNIKLGHSYFAQTVATLFRQKLHLKDNIRGLYAQGCLWKRASGGLFSSYDRCQPRATLTRLIRIYAGCAGSIAECQSFTFDTVPTGTVFWYQSTDDGITSIGEAAGTDAAVMLEGVVGNPNSLRVDAFSMPACFFRLISLLACPYNLDQAPSSGIRKGLGETRLATSNMNLTVRVKPGKNSSSETSRKITQPFSRTWLAAPSRGLVITRKPLDVSGMWWKMISKTPLFYIIWGLVGFRLTAQFSRGFLGVRATFSLVCQHNDALPTAPRNSNLSFSSDQPLVTSSCSQKNPLKVFLE